MLIDGGIFNIGDVVRLKSGGPCMTVTIPANRDDANSCYCVWFDLEHRAEPFGQSFKIETLTKVTL